MNENLQIVIGVILLAAVFVGTRVGIAWRIRKAAVNTLKDLRKRGAVSMETAVALPYAKRDWFKFGLRDFRPKAIDALLSSGMVGRTEDGRLWLADSTMVDRILNE